MKLYTNDALEADSGSATLGLLKLKFTGTLWQNAATTKLLDGYEARIIQKVVYNVAG